MTTFYQPVHRITGARGPVCAYAFDACWWIVHQPRPGDWKWAPISSENNQQQETEKHEHNAR